MRILFLSHYYAPEGNAPATRVSELARRWAAAGLEVSVVTCAPNVPSGVVYAGYANRWYQRELRDGVDLRRVWTYLAPNKGTLRRILNYLSYLASATLASLFVPRPDVVIATSPQFFCGWAGVFVSRLRRCPFVLEIRDLWPESIEAVDALRGRWLFRLLEWLELRMYAAATCIVTVGPGYQQKLVERGVDPALIHVIPNGVDRAVFDPQAPGLAQAVRELRAEFGLGERFVCAYIGTIGMGSGLEVALRAARALKAAGRDDLRLLLVGEGAVRAELEAQARREGLDALVFTGLQPKARMPVFLAAADACLVHLRRSELFRSVLPSKIFEAAAMAKPIVLGVEGFAAELVEGAGAGICIEPENESALLAAVDALAADPARARALGRAGLEGIAARYDYAATAQRYRELLDALITGKSR